MRKDGVNPDNVVVVAGGVLQTGSGNFQSNSESRFAVNSCESLGSKPDGSRMSGRGLNGSGPKWMALHLGPRQENDTIDGGEIVLREATHLLGRSRSMDIFTSLPKAQKSKLPTSTREILHPKLP